ncbi:MAG TPA: carboxypeptidase regulatory-like domain-containing protein [Pyrinomonadaceae bacterium]|jgi:hypothetical protein|nr:carboxypeptidase regulatory-like domain-containing protein [Pyrinomonadaceae bacterium]
MSFVNNSVPALVALGLLLLAPGVAAACSCGGPGVRPCAAYWEARAVFSGVVTQVAESAVRHGGGESVRPFHYKAVRFKVQDSFRGPRRRTIEVLTAPRGPNCGYSFVQGRRYLVYAQERTDGLLYTSVCTATKPLAEAGADLSFIRGLPAAPPLSAIYGNVEFGGRDLKDDSFRADPAAGLRVLVEGGPLRRETSTDARGDFAFEGLPPGSYSVRPIYPEHARGYVDPTPFELRARQCREVGYSPWWDGRILGRVLGPDGRPLAGLRVWLISPELDVSVRANLMHNMWVITDAGGSFELRNVPRGRYQLVVNLTGDTAEDNTHGYPRTFHPGVKDRARASVIELGGGEWLNVPDFKLVRDDLRPR